MRRLLPEPAADIDPFEAYQDFGAYQDFQEYRRPGTGGEREAGGDVPAAGDVPGAGGGPWLRIGMVMSADGSVTDEDAWTDGLGGQADFRVFRILRALADGIMVGAATVRTGRIGPHRMRPELRARREEIGKPDPAPMIVVSRSLELDWTLPLFTAGESIVVTTAAALRSASVPPHVRLLAAGDETVDLGQAVHDLRERFGLAHLLCEGGPVLTTSVLAAGLADELCLNLAPTLIGGGHHTRLLGELPGRAELEPTSVYLDEGVLFLRYALTRRPERHP